ncbi:MAG: PqqD family protein [Gemmatimonadota bacterium]
MIVRPHAAVIFKNVSDGAVLLHTESEIYFGLNRVGAQVWEMLATGGLSVEGVVRALQKTYPDVEPAALQSDVSELVSQLRANGLVVTDEPDGAASSSAA